MLSFRYIFAARDLIALWQQAHGSISFGNSSSTTPQRFIKDDSAAVSELGCMS